MSLEKAFTQSWYRPKGWTYIFLPVMPLVNSLVTKKRKRFLAHPENAYQAPVPIVVIGNISVGGTGKSPMVIALCELLKEQGLRPGIISRGYGGSVETPTDVMSNSDPSVVGDEPKMLMLRTACPVVVFPKRAQAAEYLLATHDVDVILCDDGMQHYKLGRDIEIAMLDAKRTVGNGELLPMGPLREPVERLNEVDFVVSITGKMTPELSALNVPVTLAKLQSKTLCSLDQTRSLSFSEAFEVNGHCHIIAGIGNPNRFLEMLYELGLAQSAQYTWFGDHHEFTESDIPKSGRVIMTEKDAVKCRSLNLDNDDVWYLPVSLDLPRDFCDSLLTKLALVKKG